MKERDERGREKGRERRSASVHSLCIYMRKENTHAHTAGQIDIFFQHACKSRIGNLAPSAKTLLRDEPTGYISSEDLPKLDFPNLCKSAMVCKERNAAVTEALVLLDTLCFSFELAK